MSDRIHITTAIAYSNGPPHFGHAYEFLATDTFARYQRRKLGRDNVSFVTGTDEHGQKNRDAAASQSLSPKAFADKISTIFRAADAKLDIEYDYFVRTTDPAHQKFVQEMLRRTHERGDVYFKDYEGLYCVGCERFYTEKELLPGNVCPEHNKPVESIKEGNYFLRLEKYREEIRAHILKHPDFIRPERYRNEALKMLEEPLSDLSISRPKARLDWGIELPFDDKFVTYVWYDAFWAYLSPLKNNDLESLRAILPVTEHFIGKDILKTHAVYWPAMLLALELPLYRHLNVHGYLNFGGARLSKSSGNMVDPVELADKYSSDILRYFVLREFVYGLDGDFTEDRLIDRFNADLANDLGNLTSRVLSMAARYFEGNLEVAPTASHSQPGVDPSDARYYLDLTSEPYRRPARYQKISFDWREAVEASIDNLDFKGALDNIWERVSLTNNYIVATSPFTLAKDPAQMPRVAQILANLIEGLRVIADTLEPFMPATSKKILALLNVDETIAHAPFGAGIKPGHRVNPTTPLFPRIEKKAAP